MIKYSTMRKEFGPADYDAAYYGYPGESVKSNYDAPYNQHGLKKDIRFRLGAALIAVEFWRKKGLDNLELLDVGGATGFFDSYLNKMPGISTHSLDLSTWATQNSVEGMKNRSVQGQASSIPFKDSAFDGLVCFDVLEHVSEDKIPQVIKEMERVLKPSGRGVILVNTNDFGDFDGDQSHVTKHDTDWWRQQFSSEFMVSSPISYPGRAQLSQYSQIAWRFAALYPSLFIIDKPSESEALSASLKDKFDSILEYSRRIEGIGVKGVIAIQSSETDKPMPTEFSLMFDEGEYFFTLDNGHQAIGYNLRDGKPSANPLTVLPLPKDVNLGDEIKDKTERRLQLLTFGHKVADTALEVMANNPGIFRPF